MSEPQLSAEMEKRFNKKFVHGENKWKTHGKRSPEQYRPREIKHFLATALEEQKQHEKTVMAQSNEWWNKKLATSKAIERAKVLSEVEGWLVDEVVTQRYSGGVYINDVLYSSGTTLDIEKLKKEVEVKNRLRAVLQAKLNQLRGTDVTK